jgi:hypothetical protein
VQKAVLRIKFIIKIVDGAQKLAAGAQQSTTLK